MRGSGNWSGCPPVMMMHWLQHNYPDNESLVCKQESVNFMMNPPSSHSLVSCGSDNNWPQNKIHRLHKEQNALHLRHHHLSKNQLWNRNISFFLQHWKLFSCIVSIVRGSWLPEPSIPAPHFLRSHHSAHLLASHPILLFRGCQEEMKCFSTDNYRPLLVTTTRNKSYISCENVENRTLLLRPKAALRVSSLPFDHYQKIHSEYTFVAQLMHYYASKTLFLEHEDEEYVESLSIPGCDGRGPTEAQACPVQPALVLPRPGESRLQLQVHWLVQPVRRDFLDVEYKV